MSKAMRKVLITGSAGFIGYHLCDALLRAGWRVVGYDGMTPYYDVNLKERRHELLTEHEGFRCEIGQLEDVDRLRAIAREEKPDVIVHLAAQAGVRYSLENPRAYVDANLVGAFNVMEIARELAVGHLLMASTSSVYGANEKIPFAETDQTDAPMTLYAATKKANEAMAHSYAHLHGIPTTMFRFFTVYGPWGRPDMAPFKFTKGVLEGAVIDVYNHGDMSRDFTYVTDLVRGIELLIDSPPPLMGVDRKVRAHDSLSPIAPYRVVNIGNGENVRLLDFIKAIEVACGREAIKNFMPMQKGDVPATWADNTLLQELTGYAPQIRVREGVQNFVDWYREYYEV
uniref:SDR family NAD(P)-dependent oxidoreductase n=1 Tax=uncultured Altererythrobacter sp. TaxID=500840 RepID=UPI00260C1D3E|nr:SDR family NAD(P)-dependent oxidoreductase [uncultured Altererythrobacter sp.]